MNTRERLANRLNKYLPEYQWKADSLIPATGAWRTNKALDVFCWEGFIVDDAGIRRFMGSYQTMTELCKCTKFEVHDSCEIIGWIEGGSE